jgi:hypothetical protein
MAEWVRQRDPLAQWHLLDQPEARVGDMGRGVILAACGLSLGHELASLQRDDGSVIGNRCPSCQGISLRWA